MTPVHELMTRLLLTRDEAARMLSIKPETLDYLHRMKRLRGVKVGKELRWRPPDVQRFVHELDVGEGG
jgi:excisionase family DNA binding protein